MPPIKISPLMQLRLNLMNVIAGLTKKEPDEAVYDTAVELTKWARRDSEGKPMREGQDFVRAAKKMVNVAKGEDGEKKG